MMRLSDAIRLGALLHPQAFGTLEAVTPMTGAVIKTCALGAAKHAGYDITDESPVCVPRCPRAGCKYESDRLFSIVAHLNDVHRWKREQIANWVATIERANERSATAWTADEVRATEAAAAERALFAYVLPKS